MVLNQNIAAQIIGLLKKNPQGLIISEIANESKINRYTAGRYLEAFSHPGKEICAAMEWPRYISCRTGSLFPLCCHYPLNSLCRLDKHLRIVYINEPFIEFLGTTRKNLVGKNVQYSPPGTGS